VLRKFTICAGSRDMDTDNAKHGDYQQRCQKTRRKACYVVKGKVRSNKNEDKTNRIVRVTLWFSSARHGRVAGAWTRGYNYGFQRPPTPVFHINVGCERTNAPQSVLQCVKWPAAVRSNRASEKSNLNHLQRSFTSRSNLQAENCTSPAFTP